MENQDNDDQLRLIIPREDKLVLCDMLRATRPPEGLSSRQLDDLADLLWAVEMRTSREGCIVEQEILASDLKISTRTLRRWIVEAQAQGLLTVIETKTDTGWRDANQYVANWERVRRLGQTRFVARSFSEVGQTQSVADDAMQEGQTQSVAFLAHAPAALPPSSATRRGGEEQWTNCPDGQDIMSAPSGHNVLTKNVNKSLKEGRQRTHSIPSKSLDPIRSISTISKKQELRAACPGIELPRGQLVLTTRGTHGGWERELTTRMLNDPQTVDDLFWFAVRKWKLRDIDRLRFHTAAVSVSRRKQEITNPPGAFTRIIKRRLWMVASQEDEQLAHRAIRKLDAAAEGQL